MEKVLKNRKFILSVCVFLAYATATFIGALNHEIWFDEGQAWCIARDNDVMGVIDLMKYEGHSPLWHFILYPFAKAGLSAAVLPFISWFVCVLTAALILWKSPFGMAMNIAAVFSGGMLFYNSVVSRVYCLIHLFLCLIAIVYPKRKQHPIAFGFLVALITNTHVIMSGFVAAIGIGMLIDLFSDWKRNTGKQNVLNIAGLGIAGMGVVLLLLPTVQSLFVSYAADQNKAPLGTMISRAENGLSNISADAAPLGGAIGYILSYAAVIAVIVTLILLRHYRRSFALALSFTAFFILTTQVMYNNLLPNRTMLFFFTFFVILWIAEAGEKPKECNYEKMQKLAGEGFVKKITDFVVKTDRNYSRILYVITAGLMVYTIPRAIRMLVFDYKNDFSLSESVAEFVENDLPEGSVIIASDWHLAQLSALMPEQKLYYIGAQDFVSYHTYKVYSDKINWQEVYDDLIEYENVYYLAVAGETYISNGVVPIYEKTTDTESFVCLKEVKLTPYDVYKELEVYLNGD